MNKYDEIYKAYYEINKFITFSSMTPTEVNDYWDKIQVKNDMAYFLLVFAQFDRFVVEYLNTILSTDETEKMGFMAKVGNLIKNNGNDYEEIDEWYELRCDISHGRKSIKEPMVIKHGRKSIKEPVVIANVCNRLKQIAEKISSSSNYV